MSRRRVLIGATAAWLTCWGVLGGAQQPDTDPPPVVDADPQPTPEPSLVRKLFATLARDVKRLSAKEPLMIIANGGVLALAAAPFDDAATLAAASSPFLKGAFSGWGKALGREWVQGGGALGAYFAGRMFHQPRLARAGGDFIEAQLLAATVTQGLKFATSRTRPDGEARSFPSGHASSAFATAAVLHRHFGRRASIPAYLVAVYTSASRLQAGSHFASDVIFGASLGLAAGHVATFELAGRPASIAPAVVPGRGVGFVVQIGSPSAAGTAAR